MARDRSDIRRDMAGVGPDPRMSGNLTRMDDAHGFKIADGEPDIRGWEVRTLSGVEVGEVEDLLVDLHRGEVVMIDVDLKDGDQHVNVPLRGVQLDRGRRCVIVDSGDIRNARDSILSETIGDRDRVEDVRATDDRVVDNSSREIRYGLLRDTSLRDTDATEEVIERRPIIEEVVVRRRVVDPGEDVGKKDE